MLTIIYLTNLLLYIWISFVSSVPLLPVTVKQTINLYAGPRLITTVPLGQSSRLLEPARASKDKASLRSDRHSKKGAQVERHL